MAEPRPQEDLSLPAPPPAPAKGPLALATMALVIAAAALLGILREVMVENQLENKVKALEATQAGDDRAHGRLSRSIEVLGNAVTTLSDEQTDLTNPKLQHLRHGFAVSELSLTRQDTGVVIAGRLINTSSLRYRDATFRVKVGSASKEFNIANLAPGASGEFEILLANTPLENAHTATFSFVSSAVGYDR
jgi:hypothetical protein